MKFGLNFLKIVTKIICEFLKFLKFVKLPSYRNVIMKVNRKYIYFIWVKLKNRKAELVHQGVKVQQNMLMCFVMIAATLYDLSLDTKPHIFRIPKSQNILNTP